MLPHMAVGSPNKLKSLIGYLIAVKNDKYLLLIMAISFFFSLLFSYLSIMRYFSLNSTAYDLGVYSQVLNSTLHGKLFYTNLLGESLLSEHFSLLLFPILIPYFFYQSPITLLVIQSFAIAFAAIPLYMLSKEWIALVNKDKKIGSRFLNFMPFSLSISFLFSPLVSGPISFDFHLMIFLPLFIFCAFYYFLKKKKLQHALFLLLIVLIHSSFVFIVISLLISEFLIYRSSKYGLREVTLKIFSKEALKYFLYFSVVVLVAGVYYYSVAYFKPIISGFPPNLNGPYSGQSGSISDSTLGLIRALFTEPNVAFSYLISNGMAKTVFLVMAFSATAFTALLFPELLVSILPYFLYGMFSSYSAYYTAGFQYSMMLIPMIFIASSGVGAKVFGMKPVSYKKLSGIYKRSVAVTLSGLILLGGLSGFIFTPFAPPSVFKNPGSVSDLWLNHPTRESQFAFNISSRVPSDAYILTQNDVFPLFSANSHSYSTPWSPGYSISDVNKFQYYVASYDSSWVYASTTGSASLYSMVNKALSTGNYGIYAEGYGLLALEKDYSGKPNYFNPVNISLSGSDLLPIGLNSTYSSGGIAASNNINGSGFFVSHRMLLLPGNYTVSINYSTTNISKHNGFLFNVSSEFSNKTFISKAVNIENSTLNGNIYTESFAFSNSIVYNDIRVGANKIYWNGNITVSSITIIENNV